MRFSAAILAGGHSSRFGQDKASYLYQGKALLSWVQESFKDADELFIIAKQDYPQFKLRVYADLIAQQGPLSGIHAALHYAKNDWLAVAACDMPFLNPDYWHKLLAFAHNKQAVMVERQGRLEPLAALYHKSCYAFLEQQLHSKNQTMQQLSRHLDSCILAFEQLEISENVLTNINYPSDLGQSHNG